MAGKRQRKKKYRFFKVLLGDFSTQLGIPPEFEKHVANEEDAFLLEGARGKTWPVEIERTGEHGYAMTGSGWVNFVRDNALQEFEFLVFGYDGHRRFGVQVFDRTACERKLQVKVKPEKSKEKAGKEEPPKVKRKRGRPRIRPLRLVDDEGGGAVGGHEQQRKDDVLEMRKKEKAGKEEPLKVKKKRGRPRTRPLPVLDGGAGAAVGGHVQQRKVVEEGDEVTVLEVKKVDRPVPVVTVGKFMQSLKGDVTLKKENLDRITKTKAMGDGNGDGIKLTSKTGGCVKPAIANTEKMEDVNDAGGKFVTNIFCCTKPATWPPLIFHEAGSIDPEDNSFKSCNPHFVAYMKTGNVCRSFTLVLPMAFARRYLPSKKAQLVLRDPKGTAWVVVYITDPKRSILSGGWAAFTHATNLKVGDLCIFELVGPIELQVHVVPSHGCKANAMKRKSLET